MITIQARDGVLSKKQMTEIFNRLMKGEKATFVIARAKMAEAEAIFAKLPAPLRALITVVASEVR